METIFFEDSLFTPRDGLRPCTVYPLHAMATQCDKGLKRDLISLPALNDTLNISHDITIFLTWTGLTEFHFLLPSNTA